MKITKEQVKKWNAGAKNGFSFDIRHAVLWNEKELLKWIELPGGDRLEIRLCYSAETVETRTTYGQTYRAPTGKQLATLHIQKWHPDGRGMMESHGIGYYIPVDGVPAQEKKNFALLQKLSENFPDEIALAIYAEQNKTPALYA